MAKFFNFLERHSSELDWFPSLEGESWQEALRSHLFLIDDDRLSLIENIYRIEDNDFVSCIEEVENERNRRIEEEANKEKAKERAKKLALFEKLKKELEL